MRRRAALCGAWLLLAAFDEPTPLVYDPGPAAANDQLTASPSTQPPDPGEQYPARLADQTVGSDPAPPAATEPRHGPLWRLTVDASAVADSNVTNSTDLETVELDLGGLILPVPLDPSLRAHGDVGYGVSASGSGRVPVGEGVALALDAEGYVLEYDGSVTDDASLLLAFGTEVTGAGGDILLVEVTGFERRFGGISAMRGVGLRGRYQRPAGEGARVSLLVDGRIFDSGYGDDFGGTEAGAYLSYEATLAPGLSGSLGVYGRGSWLGADAYSNREFGAYGGLNRYLGDYLTGGVSGGISRVVFRGPIAVLGPEARRDWRWYGSAYLTARRPVLVGLTPSLTYTYNRTGSSIEFYRAERHRLRFGLSRTF
jgi:hypothetical protein